VNYIETEEFINRCFSVEDVVTYLRNKGVEVSNSTIRKEIDHKLKDNSIIRIGRSRYIINSEKKEKYTPSYSRESNKIINAISKTYPLVEFTVFESKQLNEFLNHQIAHNTVFISVEKDLQGHIFNLLKDKYFGKVLLNPSKEEYFKYWTDNTIVVNRLVTEYPSNKERKYQLKMEKMLVDIFANKIEAESFNKEELKSIYSEAINKYVIDRSSLLRYARRRNVESKVKALLNSNL